jgi:hypothetical protein
MVSYWTYNIVVGKKQATSNTKVFFGSFSQIAHHMMPFTIKMPPVVG